MSSIVRQKAILFYLLSVVLLLTACQSSNQNTAAKKQGKPEQGGELIYGLATSPDSLDPHTSGMAVSTRVNNSIYENLVYQTTDNKIEPWLATKWEVSKDQKTFTFTLRDDVTFQDGSKLNAEVVKYNFDRIVNPETKAASAYALIENYQSSEVVDDYTITFHFSSPSATFLSNLSQPKLAIVSKQAAQKYGLSLATHPVGSGPFKFVSLDENNEIVLERFEDYKGKAPFAKHDGKAYLDKLVYKIIPEEATRIGSVQSNQINAVETVPPQDVQSIKNSKNLKIFETETAGMPYGLFLNPKNAPWNQLEARQALQETIDVEQIVQTLYLGTYKQAWSVITPTILGYNKDLEGKGKLDIAHANELLEGLGWKKNSDGIRGKDGKELVLRLIDSNVNREKRHDIATIIQQQLKEIGVQLEITTTADYYNITKNGKDYDVIGNSRVAGDPDVLRLFFHSEKLPENGGSNLARLADKEIDKWLEQGELETDTAKRVDLYKKVQEKLIDQAYFIPIYVFPYTVAASNNVEGLAFDSQGYPLFNDVFLTN
ncbi:ABC transporter substrate-binding protein [Niallia nealsonii]|uniref:ABC transporter substrate-binding protein n=1 Tax=Niallia nealsonii TaxID=115979 RepID=A0A2N0Z043_9BACI|nr:ABC transporter substrate-binding protein [Niallia nealsonii]PKG22869.1 ABC transporter substrate-binding protein [Niallia nealsonii]